MSRKRDRVPGSGDPRKLSAAQAQIAQVLGPLEGARIPGGCDHCDAYQTVEPFQAGIWKISVHHDDWCPWFARYESEVA